jgi:hypothetical protein
MSILNTLLRRWAQVSAGWRIGYISGQLSPTQALLHNGFTSMIGAVKLKGILAISMPYILIVVMSISHPRLRSYRLNLVWKTAPG